MKKIHQTSEAPAAIGPYSQAVEVDGWVFCSGQIPLDAQTGQVIEGGVKEQTKKIMENVGAVLKASDLNYSNIIKTTIFLSDMSHFQVVNDVYGAYFKENPPARSTVAVKGLPKSVDVEIEVIARRF